jgi:hypothetical protein
MTKERKAHRRVAAVFAMLAVILTGISMLASNASADDREPDFLVLNPERE